MRSWLFHPLIFYPLAILFALLVITISLRPQAWPREPAPAAAQSDGAALMFTGAAFNSPQGDPAQNMTVVRDFWGAAQSLRIAVHPDLAPPTAQDRGVRLLLTREDAARLSNRALTVDVSYEALPVNAAQALAVSAQGAGQTNWIVQDIPPQNATVRFELPPQSAVNAIGLRAVNSEGVAAFGLEITRIRIVPHA